MTKIIFWPNLGHKVKSNWIITFGAENHNEINCLIRFLKKL